MVEVVPGIRVVGVVVPLGGLLGFLLVRGVGLGRGVKGQGSGAPLVIAVVFHLRGVAGGVILLGGGEIVQIADLRVVEPGNRYAGRSA